MNMSNNFENGEYKLSVQEYAELITSCAPRELFEAVNEPVNPTTFSIEMFNILI